MKQKIPLSLQVTEKPSITDIIYRGGVYLPIQKSIYVSLSESPSMLLKTLNPNLFFFPPGILIIWLIFPLWPHGGNAAPGTTVIVQAERKEEKFLLIMEKRFYRDFFLCHIERIYVWPCLAERRYFRRYFSLLESK